MGKRREQFAVSFRQLAEEGVVLELVSHHRSTSSAGGPPCPLEEALDSSSLQVDVDPFERRA